MNKSYTTTLLKKNFFEKYIYLKTFQEIFCTTFDNKRFLNQELYSSSKWKRVRRDVIIRDNGCDLGVPGMEIVGRIVVHHINPITPEDILNDDPKVFDMENLICCSFDTHERLHFGLPPKQMEPTIRQEGDTKLW